MIYRFFKSIQKHFKNPPYSTLLIYNVFQVQQLYKNICKPGPLNWEMFWEARNCISTPKKLWHSRLRIKQKYSPKQVKDMKSLVAADRPYGYILLGASPSFIIVEAHKKLEDSSRERKLLHQVGFFVQSWVERNNKRSNKMRQNLSGRVLLLSWFFCLSFEGQCSESYMLLLLKKEENRRVIQKIYKIFYIIFFPCISWNNP